MYVIRFDSAAQPDMPPLFLSNQRVAMAARAKLTCVESDLRVFVMRSDAEAAARGGPRIQRTLKRERLVASVVALASTKRHLAKPEDAGQW